MCGGMTTDLPPASDLLLRPDAWTICYTNRVVRDRRSLRNDKRAGSAGALGVVLCHEVRRYVTYVRSPTAEGSHDDPVGEVHAANLNWLEEFRVAHVEIEI